MRWRNQLIKSKSEWNYVRIPRTKGPKPTLPIPRLFRPWINRLTKLLSLKWIRFFFSLLVNVHDLSTKDEKLSVFVCLCVLYLLKKWKNYSQHLSFFSFFLLQWNYGKLGDRYAIFLFFHFLEQNGKNEKMVRINVIFSFFCFSIFWEKQKNRKMI